MAAAWAPLLFDGEGRSCRRVRCTRIYSTVSRDGERCEKIGPVCNATVQPLPPSKIASISRLTFPSPRENFSPGNPVCRSRLQR